MIPDFRKNIRRLKNVVSREIRYVSPRPAEVNLELTHRCNLRCRMCGVWGKKNADRRTELALEEYRALFVQMRALGVRLVTLAGGEPFIREDLFDIICAAKSQGLACNLFSNGTLLDRRRRDRLFECRVDKVIISIDGIGTVHDAVRGIPGTYDKALAALSALVAERRERGAAGPEIDVHMTLLKENVSSLAPLYNVCRSLGVNFSFQPYSETHEAVVQKTELNGAAIGSPRYLAHEDSLHFSARQVGQIREAVLGLPSSFYTKLLLSFSDAQLQQGRMPVRKCYITRHFMMIDPYGGVYPCTNLDGYIVGSVRDQALARIWNGEKYDALRQKLSRRLLPVCDYCCHPADNLSLAQLAALLLTRNSRSS